MQPAKWNHESGNGYGYEFRSDGYRCENKVAGVIR